MNKNKKIASDKIIEFAKSKYNKFGIIPSRRKIEKKFNVSLDTYFKGGMRGLFKLCKFRFTPEENKQRARKKIYLKKSKQRRKKIIEYFTQQIKKGIIPTRVCIQKKFSTSLESCFPEGIRGLYQSAGINLPIRLRDKEKLQRQIVKYIQLQVKKGFYPTHGEINEKFHTNIGGSIKKLYELAEVEYKRDPNPFLKYKKEKKLTEIAKKLLPRLGYKIKSISIGPSKPKGADIIIEDKQKRVIPVEIKAFQKFGKIGHAKNSPYIRNEILQLKRYIKTLQALYGYLITSTDRKTIKTIPPNIKVLFGKDLKKLLLKFKMYKELKDLEWIRNSSISYGKEKMYKKIHDKILEYVRQKWEDGKYVSKQEILKRFRVNPDSYFPRGTKQIYEELGLDPELISNYRMSRNFDKEKFKKKIITFVREEIKKGYFPTHKEIQRKFRCLVKLHFPGGIREIANLAGIKYNRKFATKTLEEREIIRQKIIYYFKKELQNGYFPTHWDIRSYFHIDPRFYFKNINEIYHKAGYNSPVKKTWKNSGKILNYYEDSNWFKKPGKN